MRLYADRQLAYVSRMAFFASGRNLSRIAGIAGLLLLTAAIASPGAVGQTPSATLSSLAGQYDGGQMEMAAGLELRPDGRFDYGLSYGALDESASGTWRVDDGRVLLTSDTVKAPMFTLLENRPATDGKMRIVLDLPERWSRQGFHAEIGLEDGRVVERQLSDDDNVIALEPGERPVSVRVGMSVFDLRSDEVRLAGGSAAKIHMRFDPNDLGKVAFADTPLRIDGRTLILDRFGRTIVFRRIGGKGR